MKKLFSGILVGAMIAMWTPTSFAASEVWDGSTSTAFETATNYVSNTTPGATVGVTSADVVTFSGAGNGNIAVVNDASRNVAGITFDTGLAAAYTIGTTVGNALLLTNAGTIQTTATVANIETINAPLVLEGAGGTYTFTSGSTVAAADVLNLGGGITGGAAGATVLTLNGTNTGNNTISGIIGNGSATSVAITKAGAGTWILSGANTYTGATAIDVGTIKVGAVAGLGAVSTGTTVASGASLDLNGIAVLTEPLTISGIGVGGLGALNNTSAVAASLSGAVTLGAASTITSTGAGGLTLSGTVANGGFLLTEAGANAGAISGILSGTGGLTKTEAGALTLSGINTYSGANTISGGSVLISAASGLGNSAATNTISMSGNGILRSTSGTYSLGTTRTIALTGNASIQSDAGTLTVDGAVATAANALTLTGAGNTTVSGVIGTAATAGTLVKTGAGTATLSGANIYTGLTTITTGVLNIQNATATGTSAGGIAVADGAALQMQGNIAVGAEALGITGTGVVATGALRNISGTNSYAGAVTLAGVTRINSDAGTLTLGAGGITGGFGLTFGGAGNTTVSGVIGTGANTLTKDGAGILSLGGVNTYSGLTTVSAGTLAIPNAATIAGALTLGAAGTLDLGANTLTNTGAVTTSAATTVIKTTANSSASFGKIVSVAVGSIFAGTIVDVNVAGALTSGTAMAVLDAGGGANVAINVTDNSARYTFAGAMAGGDISITPTIVPSSTLTTSSNTANAGAVFDAIITTATGDMLVVENALSTLSASQFDDALEQTTPNVDAGITQGSFAAMAGYTNALGLHLDEVRGTNTGKSGVSTGDSYAEPSFKDGGIWLKGLTGFGDQKDRKGVYGYDSKLWGVVGGADGLVSDNFRLGLAGGYAQSDIDTKHVSDNTGIDSYQGTLYGTYTAEPWYVDSSFSFGWNQYDGSRTINFPGVDRIAQASYDGQQYTGLLDVGYVWKNMEIEKGQEWDITPMAGFTYSHLNIDSYTETNAGDLNLNVNSQGYDLAQSSLGLKISRPFKDDSDTYVPEIHGKWLYDFVGDKAATTATFTGGGSSFSTNGVSPAQSSFDAGAGLTVYKGNMSVSLVYDFEVKSDYMSHTGQGVIRYTF